MPPPGNLYSVYVTNEKEVSCQVTVRLNTLVALTSHHTVNRLTLYIWLDAVNYFKGNKNNLQPNKKLKR